MSAQIDALRGVLAAQPDNHDVRAVLIDLLVAAGRDTEALTDYQLLHQAGALGPDARMKAASLALKAGETDLANRLLQDADATAGDAATVPPVDDEPLYVPDDFADEALTARTQDSRTQDSRTQDYGTEPERSGPGEIRGSDFIDQGAGVMTFADVGGLTDVKKVINRLIIQPLERPELFKKYGKTAGGGVLLYGPPGCGKTLIAQATAGEAGLPFYNLRIEDLVDPYFGVTEQRIARAFEAARELQPCILFIDELDALGFARSQSNSDRGRAMVEVLLQQLDSIGSDNTGLLVLAASNEPWDIDSALLRPGRFDRTIFVPPPDEEARSAIINRRVQSIPHDRLDIKRLVKATMLFSGADLRELLDRGLEEVLDEALQLGTEPPLTQAHLDHALTEVRPTTLTWLSRARNHADFGNIGGRWDDVQAFLKQRSVAKQLRLQDPKRDV